VKEMTLSRPSSLIKTMDDQSKSQGVDVMAVRRTIAGLDRIFRDLLLERDALAAKLPQERKL